MCYFIFLALFLFSACSTPEETSEEYMRRLNQKGEYIYRQDNEYLFSVTLPEKKVSEPYPWEFGERGKYPRITKDFFRCKGSSLNPVRVAQTKEKETARYYDCGGCQRHSLPLRDGKEFIYPILVDVLNHIQLKTGKRIVITSGHRCPDHNIYVDPSPENQYSKHMIGAEVAFYVQGMENSPEVIVKLILDYYRESPRYFGLKGYQEFQRYEKEDANIAVPPWYNTELFIKIFNKKEGRNFDNRHPYPYISIQVRYDFDLQEKVIYSWDKANHNYLRG